MKAFRVTSPVSFHADQIIGLSKAQSDARSHNLKIIKEGKDGVVAKATASIHFKAGEVVSLDNPPKGLADKLEAVPPSRAA